MHLIGISGSLRKASYNTALLRAAFDDLPDGGTAEVVALNGIPIYDWELEQAGGFPAPVAELRAKIEAADGIVFATPEYNFSVTGALKNAIDWLSRGPFSPLDFKPAAIIGAGGGGGTRRAQHHLRDILQHNSLRVLAEPQVMVPKARMQFDGLELINESVHADLRLMVEGLVDLIERTDGTEAPAVRGSVLVVAPDAASAGSLARQAAERAYRTLTATTVVDAVQEMAGRMVAAVVLDSALDRAERMVIGEALTQHHPTATLIIASDPAGVGSQLDAELRYQPATR
jgi:chromate reductase